MVRACSIAHILYLMSSSTDNSILKSLISFSYELKIFFTLTTAISSVVAALYTGLLATNGGEVIIACIIYSDLILSAGHLFFTIDMLKQIEFDNKGSRYY